MFKYIFCLIILFAASFRTKAALPEGSLPKESLIQFDAEIFIYKGIQYYNFVFRPDKFGAIVSELAVSEVPLRKWKTMEMSYLRKKWDRNTDIQIQCENYYCESISVQAINRQTKKIQLACTFYIYRGDLFWLKKNYECDRPVKMTIENDNEE